MILYSLRTAGLSISPINDRVEYFWRFRHASILTLSIYFQHNLLYFTLCSSRKWKWVSCHIDTLIWANDGHIIPWNIYVYFFYRMSFDVKDGIIDIVICVNSQTKKMGYRLYGINRDVRYYKRLTRIFQY